MRKYLKVIIPLFALQIIFLPAGWILDTDMP